MNPAKALFERFKAYHTDGRSMVKLTGMVGSVFYPLFYLLRFTKAEPPQHDDVYYRAIATALALSVALKDHWPERLKPYYLHWAYFSFLYCLPFFFVITSLKSGGGVIAVANTMLGIFFLILLTDWRNTIVTLLLGTALAVAVFVLTTPDATFPMDYVARFPTAMLVVIGGSLFKYSESQVEAVRRRAMASLAGSIAHEMRNPLSQIRYSLDSVERVLPTPRLGSADSKVSAPQLHELYRHLAQGQIAIRRGLQVISMTLDEVNAKPIDTRSFTNCSAAATTRKALDEYGYETPDERGKVSMEVVQDFTFKGDETLYIFVLFNLIKNALYYFKAYPHARLVITVDAGQVRVRDNGPGIAPEQMARLFGSFHTSGKQGGTGLGLAYCKRAMQAFGGEISCESSLGQGTEFTLRFPVVSGAQQDGEERELMAAAAAELRGLRVLVVDDLPVIRQSTRTKLAPLGCVVEEAADGAVALERLAAADYGFVIMDLNMPVLDGYTATERIRAGAVPRNRYVPILAHTSEAPHMAGIVARKLGMDGFVSKPCSQLDLVQAMRQALASVRERQPVAGGASSLAGKTVLLAEDSDYGRKIVRTYLESMGLRVVEAAHGLQALEQLDRYPDIDAVLMDIQMPGMGGLEAARQLRSQGGRRGRLPIIALTADSDDASIAATRDAGMNGFITKPVDVELLTRELGRWMVGPTPGASARRPYATAPGASPQVLAPQYLSEVNALVRQLGLRVQARDLGGLQNTLHSLLALSGHASGSALHDIVRDLYDQVRNEGRWPAGSGWLGDLEKACAELAVKET